MGSEIQRGCWQQAVFPGVALRFAAAGEAPRQLPEEREDLCALYYCHIGSVSIAGKEKQAELCPRDVWFVPNRLSRFRMTFSGDHEGLWLLLLPEQLPPAALSAFGIQVDTMALEQAFLRREGQIIRGVNEVSTTLAQIAQERDAYGDGYVRMKTAELLLYLGTGRPESRPASPETWRQEERVREICRYLTEHLDERMSQALIAKKFHISLTALKLTFQHLYGLPLDTYLRRERISEAQRLLRESDLPIAQIAEKMGYGSHSQFSAAFRAGTGESPLSYRQRMRTELS